MWKLLVKKFRAFVRREELSIKAMEWRGSCWAREMMQAHSPDVVLGYLGAHSGIGEGEVLRSFDRGARSTVNAALGRTKKRPELVLVDLSSREPPSKFTAGAPMRESPLGPLRPLYLVPRE